MLRRALRLAPQKARQQILLDFAKSEFFTNHLAQAAGLLIEAGRLFPDEWKLQLEYVQQLVGAPRGVDRRCCRTGWWRRCG